MTPDGCLWSECKSDCEWCEKAADGFRGVHHVQECLKESAAGWIWSLVSFEQALEDEVVRVPIRYSYEWCEEATDGFRDVLHVQESLKESAAGWIWSLVSFELDLGDEVEWILIRYKPPWNILKLSNPVFRFTAMRPDTPIQRPYATASVTDWVVVVEIQCMRPIGSFPEYIRL
nr:unnamed protein product [Spirometra erinaceieuropaei]